jgi:hypothetical protein
LTLYLYGANLTFVVNLESLPLREGFRELFNTPAHMIKCSETDVSLKAGDEIFVVTRMHDPHSFPLSKRVVESIPQEWRTSARHTYKNRGGVNIHPAVITGSNGSSAIKEDRDTLCFSIPKYKVKEFLPNTSKNFEFPG